MGGEVWARYSLPLLSISRMTERRTSEPSSMRSPCTTISTWFKSFMLVRKRSFCLGSDLPPPTPPVANGVGHQVFRSVAILPVLSSAGFTSVLTSHLLADSSARRASASFSLRSSRRELPGANPPICKAAFLGPARPNLRGRLFCTNQPVLHRYYASTCLSIAYISFFVEINRRLER